MDLLNKKNGSHAAEVINAAYGLVQGVYGDGDMMSDAGHEAWKRPEVESAAMKAAEAFIRELMKQQ